MSYAYLKYINLFFVLTVAWVQLLIAKDRSWPGFSGCSQRISTTMVLEGQKRIRGYTGIIILKTLFFIANE